MSRYLFCCLPCCWLAMALVPWLFRLQMHSTVQTLSSAGASLDVHTGKTYQPITAEIDIHLCDTRTGQLLSPASCPAVVSHV